MKVAIAGSRNVQVLNLEADKSFPPPGSKFTSLYCGSIFDPPSKRKIPANLTACGVFWSWQCDSNTRPADYESAALPTELYQHFLFSYRGLIAAPSVPPPERHAISDIK